MILINKFCFCFISVFVITINFAQVPQKINYQAIVRDNSNELLINKKVGLKVSILQLDSQMVYSEIHTSQTNQNGLITLQIGGGKSVFNVFSKINWANTPTFLKLEYDPAGGNNYIISQTTELLSVPYALYAGSSGNNIPGPQGEKGDRGAVGPTGPVGPIGPALTFKVSNIGDTLKLSNGNYVLIPGISSLNHQVKDVDGNVYKTYLIGDQTWMGENLRTTKLNDGNLISNISSPTEWITTSKTAYCSFNNDEQNKLKYGLLYNYYAVNSKICPIGWHVPSDVEWLKLINLLGGESTAGGKLKEVGTTFWKTPNTGASNSSFFSALGGGRRSDIDGSDGALNQVGIWWTSTVNSSSKIWVRTLKSTDTKVEKVQSEFTGGYSVRCLKD